MKKICLIIFFLIFVLAAGGRVNADTYPGSGSSRVNAVVSQPPTATPTPTNIPTATPTLAPGVSATPVPSGTITKPPTPTLIIKYVYINISGLASPNATIVMTSNNVFLRSTVADNEGYFSITQIKLNEANATFCLDTTDFKRIGSSYVCLPTPTRKENFTRNNIFLPPTMGLSARKINYKGYANAFGYTMPNSRVTTFVTKDRTLKVDADDSGYYKVKVQDLPVGTYYLFATAVFQKLDSEKPDKTQELQSLRDGGVGKESKSIIEKLFSSIAWFIEHGGWIVIPIIILIIILLSKRLRQKLLNLIPVGKLKSYESKIHVNEDKKLHHDWML